MCWRCIEDTIPWNAPTTSQIAIHMLLMVELYGPVIDVAIPHGVNIGDLGAELALEGVFLREYGANVHAPAYKEDEADRTTEAA